MRRPLSPLRLPPAAAAAAARDGLAFGEDAAEADGDDDVRRVYGEDDLDDEDDRDVEARARSGRAGPERLRR